MQADKAGKRPFKYIIKKLKTISRKLKRLN